MKNKCADTVANILVDDIILRFGMPLVIHSDQGREFENGLMKSLCNLLGCTKTRTAPYHPESDGMIKRFNRTCLMMLSMFVNDRRDNWNELLPFVMHAYRTSVHESTGYSPFRLMMGEECSLPQDVSTAELRAKRENYVAPHLTLMDKPIIFVHVDDLKICPGPQDVSWIPNAPTAKSLCASTVAFRPGSHIGEVTPDPSVDVSAWGEESDIHHDSTIPKDLDKPIDLTGHILSPFYQREIIYQDFASFTQLRICCATDTLSLMIKRHLPQAIANGPAT